MLLLVFMAITYSFLAKEEGLKDIPLVQKQLREAQSRIAELEGENSTLKAQLQASRERIAELERFIRGMGINPKTFQPDSGVISSGRISSIAEGQQRLDNANRIIASLQQENGLLRKTLGGKAPGLPRCLATSGYLIDFTLLADGRIRGAPAWEAGAEVSALPGVATLASGQPLSLDAFRAAAAQLNAWADVQAEPCRFSIRETHETQNLGTFEGQLTVLERFFYVKRT
ncbi:MAG: hypothetical protein WDM91_04090 [Rhizomicrobium sp.]